MKVKLTLAAALLAMACIAAPAQAGTNNTTRTEIAVSYADLDLHSAAGADAMLARLHRMSAHACGTRPAQSHSPLRARRAFDQCRANAVANAVQDLDAPLVTARFAAARNDRYRIASR